MDSGSSGLLRSARSGSTLTAHSRRRPAAAPSDSAPLARARTTDTVSLDAPLVLEPAGCGFLLALLGGLIAGAAGALRLAAAPGRRTQECGMTDALYEADVRRRSSPKGAAARARSRRQADDPRRRIRRARGPERIRQDDAVAATRRARPGVRRAGLSSTAATSASPSRRRARRAPPPRVRLRLPAVQPDPLPDRAREHRVRRLRLIGFNGTSCDLVAAPSRRSASPPAPIPPEAALRRRAATGRHRPGPRPRPHMILPDEPTGALDTKTGHASSNSSPGSPAARHHRDRRDPRRRARSPCRSARHCNARRPAWSSPCLREFLRSFQPAA